MELDPEALVLRIDEAVGVAAETVHVTVRRRDAAIAHDHSDLVQGFGQQGPEVPVVRGAVHVGARVALDHMVQVGELERVTQEKDRRVVAHHVPVALVRVEFDGKAADVALRVRCAALAGHSGKTDEDFGLLADLGKERGLGILSDVMRHRERPVRIRKIPERKICTSCVTQNRHRKRVHNLCGQQQKHLFLQSDCRKRSQRKSLSEEEPDFSDIPCAAEWHRRC